MVFSVVFPEKKWAKAGAAGRHKKAGGRWYHHLFQDVAPKRGDTDTAGVKEGQPDNH
jgi:hypothetical protein